ncbi:TRAP transporter substrate-binding protein [Pseudooceanicola sediminis]|uniref:TRAP transporter substrate-binding protein n=1 Tax=Pseudooceanicola sediminis TaxID=2211117 RepID=A0A399J894_9RHOB|nr:TRAP transporter substrate-binding protein [Pseudooceanicola sediminis]KAA2315053.1 TRAP transporter substrate-binding protein [Puniceibacterium sp. HSS470]RII38866.1 TRAP transporter substrate-binding protein [Pseudooceanicola sediminis]|tara:strand:- start:56567 stop:57580 length:1014 start_codon:yes stop_codon:yes gene_type:complete
MTQFDKMNRRSVLAMGAGAAMVAGLPLAASAKTTLRYGHNNEPASVAGAQADWFAEALAEASGGDMEVQVFPASQLGKLQELAEAVSLGTIAFSHNTAGGIGSLYEPFGALDTPYLYRDVDHLMKVTDVSSPVMQMLNEGLIAAAGVRVIYSHYFGKRNLTCNKEIRSPADLAGVKIRAVPFPMYTTAVEGMGAVAVPVDWSEVPTALATGVVQGQENPVNVVLNVKLYEVQKNLMLTGHMTNAEMVVMNESVWQGLSAAQQAAVQAAAEATRIKATKAILDNEEAETQALRDLGMNVIGAEDGLDLEAFRASVSTLVSERFGERYGEIYDMIGKIA